MTDQISDSPVQPHRQKMHPVSCVIFLLVLLPFVAAVGYCLYLTLAPLFISLTPAGG